jgi:hypothetical protein
VSVRRPILFSFLGCLCPGLCSRRRERATDRFGQASHLVASGNRTAQRVWPIGVSPFNGLTKVALSAPAGERWLRLGEKSLAGLLSSTPVQCGVVPMVFDQQPMVCSLAKLYALSTVALAAQLGMHACVPSQAVCVSASGRGGWKGVGKIRVVLSLQADRQSWLTGEK